MSCAEISDNLKTLPKQLEKFTKSLLSISTLKAIDSRGYSAGELKLRDEIRKDVIDYASNTMPSCIEFVEMLKCFFTRWSRASFEDWLSNLHVIIDQLENLQKRCETEYENHLNLTGNFKRSRMSAMKLAQNVEKMAADKATRKEKLDKLAASNRRWDIGTKVCIIGLFMDLGYSEEQGKLEQRAVRAGEQLQISKADRDILRTHLIPALDQIIECLLKSSQSLSNLRSNLRTLNDQAEYSLLEKLQEQYNAMTKSIQDINSTLYELYAIAPHVETDLLALKDRT